ncbi:hypothetical protein HZH66_004703 [Vespula vulgaris]|uniref:Uncharacterized protein n=1 Tax=Vespula vulgaris TaxID=7454 RepID=A0A834KEG5_VESVU|nr:hypothetical protein HZH66_004703 [Vespula vulgaris]
MNRREVQSHRETSIENNNVASTRMCCSDGPGGTRLTRCGVVCGLAALAALSTALLGPAWLHTEEKIPLSYISNNSPILVSVRFKLGLFRVCPKIVKPSNLTIPRALALLQFRIGSRGGARVGEDGERAERGSGREGSGSPLGMEKLRRF